MLDVKAVRFGGVGGKERAFKNLLGTKDKKEPNLANGMLREGGIKNPNMPGLPLPANVPIRVPLVSRNPVESKPAE